MPIIAQNKIPLENNYLFLEPIQLSKDIFLILSQIKLAFLKL